MSLMKFVQKREPAWKELQNTLVRIEAKGLKSLDDTELSGFIKCYRQVSSDLNYLQTHFSESRYSSYLNNLLSRCHTHIHISEGRSRAVIKEMFLHGFPALLRREKFLFLLSLAVFALASLAAYFSVYLDAPWSYKLVPPETRVLMEERGLELEKGEAIIGFPQQPLFASYIMTNNIQVSFLAFASGIFFGLGTLYILIVNGVMLGSLAAVYALQGQSLLFWALILPHGIMELTAIFIAAAAGLILGRALLMPGDYTRMDSLRKGGRSALVLVMGTIPMFIAAALIEGFLTPSALEPVIKLIFAGLTALLLGRYLLWKKGKQAGV